ncbi:MAG: type I restriction endonuclease [Tepidisphaeraceae bacterium]
MDWQHPDRNDFAIAEEVTLRGSFERRPDLVLYINGIAVGVIELKNSRISIGDGIRQLISNQRPEFHAWFFSTVQTVFAGNDSESVFKHVDKLARAVNAEVTASTEACVILFNGDAAFGGKGDEFAYAAGLIVAVRTHLTFAHSSLPIYVLTVPGNHDCDLTSEDAEARNTLRRTVFTNMPTPSVAKVLLSAQAEYFKFAKTVCAGQPALSQEQPYYCFCDVLLTDGVVRIHLLNSAWTSVLHETDDLRYPVAAFHPPTEPEAAYSIAALHHPAHWFLMPDVRRDLRDRLESHSDLILTGHEHENEASRRLVLEGGEIGYIEGGVLSDHHQSDICTFNIIRIDLAADKQLIKRLRFADDHFEPVGNPEESSLLQNRLRLDRQFRLAASFEEWLDELEDPLTHPREEDIRLSHLFSFPDLRKITSVGGSGKEEGRAEEIVERVKSDAVVAEISSQIRSMIVGGDKSGKTSLLKRLFLELHRQGFVPLFLKSSDLVRTGNPDVLRKHIEREIKNQYQLLTPAAFEQLPSEKKVLLLDDFQDAPVDAKARRKTTDFIEARFSKSILTASGDFYIELIGQRGSAELTPLLLHQKYEIAEFGKQRFEDLALRWTSLGRQDQDPAHIRGLALDLCEKVQSLIAAAGLPHTPWLLAVILEHDESPDATIAAKNGDYGHLYHAVITVRLAKSKFTRFNLNGKFTYLSEFAYYLHKNKRSTLSDHQAREFHAELSKRYDLTFDFKEVRDDLIDTRMLRLDGEELAFRHKYVYSFFVAYWLSRNIHKDGATSDVRELCKALHRDVSANVLVFLSHLTDHPLVLAEMRAAAARLYNSRTVASMVEELDALNKLEGVEGFFWLPPTAPEVNRKLLQDAEDERLTREKSIQHDDGRSIGADADIEDEDTSEVHAELRNLRSALRTMRILGQVLRNKSLSLEGADKFGLMDEVVLLERRLLGHIYSFLDKLDEMIVGIRKRLMRVLVEARQQEAGASGGTDGDAVSSATKPKLSRAELRDLWREAEVQARRFWFDMYWLATFGLSKRLAASIGSRELESTLAKVRDKDGSLPVRLVELLSRLNRRSLTIPADDVVKLHKELSKSGNKLARVVLEAMVWERLMLFETDVAQKQAVCKQMGIDVPIQSLDPSRKKFSPPRMGQA